MAESGLEVGSLPGQAHESAFEPARARSADASAIDRDPNAEPELVEPDTWALERESSAETPLIGHERMSFEPWIPVIVGDIDVLDNIARKVNKAKVRAVARSWSCSGRNSGSAVSSARSVGVRSRVVTSRLPGVTGR
jgi:hypothetical protein